MNSATYEYQGEQRTVDFVIGQVGAKVAGRMGGGQDLPRDDQQYAYTRGSPGYQAACRAIWASPEWQEAVSEYEATWGALALG